MTASLAYRKNEAAILRGEVPAKYTRILPYISGERIIELGSAEGVLACLLAQQGKSVTAVEKSKERHITAGNLCAQWGGQGLMRGAGNITLVNDSAAAALSQFNAGVFDTLVAVRMIYYLRDQLDEVFAAIAEKVPCVVLCGNKQRAAWWRQGVPDKQGGPVNYYASAEGMRDLLTRHGYDIVDKVTEGDAIVVGRRA